MFCHLQLILIGTHSKNLLCRPITHGDIVCTCAKITVTDIIALFYSFIGSIYLIVNGVAFFDVDEYWYCEDTMLSSYSAQHFLL